MKGFIDFVREQGAVGSIQKVVSSLVTDIINPFFSAILGAAGNMKDQFLQIGSVKIMWGNFLNSTIDFLIIAAVVYFGVKALKIDRLDKKKS